MYKFKPEDIVMVRHHKKIPNCEHKHYLTNYKGIEMVIIKICKNQQYPILCGVKKLSGFSDRAWFMAKELELVNKPLNLEEVFKI